MRNVYKNIRLMDLRYEIRDLVRSRNIEPAECVAVDWSDEYLGDALEDATKFQMASILNETLTKKLPLHEERVLRLRFWFDLDIKEIAKVIDLSQKRVRQIEAKAIRRLRELIFPLFQQEQGA